MVHRPCKEVKVTPSVCICVWVYVCRAEPVALGKRKRRQKTRLSTQKAFINTKELTFREKEFVCL